MRDEMMRLINVTSWGDQLIEDTETQQISFQCLCGQIALYFQRIMLTPDELRAIHAGEFDYDAMVRAMCKKAPSVLDRLVDPVSVED